MAQGYGSILSVSNGRIVGHYTLFGFSVSSCGLLVNARWWNKLLISAYCGGKIASRIALHDGCHNDHRHERE